MKTNSTTDISKLISMLRKNLLFENVDEQRLSKTLKNIHLVDIEKDEILFKKGETYHKGVYYLLAGEIDYYDNGNKLATLLEGDIVGLTTFLGKSTYSVTSKASNNSELIYFPEICIYKLLSDSGDFRKRFYKMVADRLKTLHGQAGFTTPSFSYKPVANYMTSPVISLPEDSSVIQVSKTMSENKIGSIVITDKSGELSGIISTKDIVHNIIPGIQTDTLKKSVKHFIKDSSLSVPKEYPIVEVLADLQEKNKDYAVIVENNRPKGIISSTDILKILYRNVHVYNLHIEQAKNLDDLQKVFNDLSNVAEHLLENTRKSSEILPVLSNIHLNIQNKVHRFTMQSYFEETGKNISEINHSLLIMGSGARKEMFLDPDQDNGFIFEDGISEDDYSTLMDFGKYFINNLDYVGYKKCPGNIMVTNPEMSKTLSKWKSDVTKIFNNPGTKGFLTSSIIFDMDCFYGSEEMVWELKNLILRLIAERPIFLIQLLEKDSNQKIPVSIFGKFQVPKDGEHKDMLNLKMSALTFIIDITRIFSLSKNLNDINTVERLKHLERKKILSEELVQEVLSAYETVVDILINEQISQSKRNYSPNKYVNPFKLSLYNQNKLKDAFNIINKYLNTGIKYYKGHP